MKNFKAVGVCYNNMGCLKYRNGFYDQASDSFASSIKFAKDEMKDNLKNDAVIKDSLIE